MLFGYSDDIQKQASSPNAYRWSHIIDHVFVLYCRNIWNDEQNEYKGLSVFLHEPRPSGNHGDVEFITEWNVIYLDLELNVHEDTQVPVIT